jgi:exosome complex component RRP46
MSCGLGMLKRSDGSGKFDFGSSIVLCGVYGPVQASLKEELVDKALISVTFTPLAGAGGLFISFWIYLLILLRVLNTGTQDRLYEKILGQIAGSLILANLYPKTVIKITCQTMSQDGSILSAAINAMILALLDSGLPMKTTCCAVACIINKDGDLILDPTALELEV